MAKMTTEEKAQRQAIRRDQREQAKRGAFRGYSDLDDSVASEAEAEILAERAKFHNVST